MFKECLRHNIVPLIIEKNINYFITEDLKNMKMRKTDFLIPVCLHKMIL